MDSMSRKIKNRLQKAEPIYCYITDVVAHDTLINLSFELRTNMGNNCYFYFLKFKNLS
jgi:hypothetical protein